MNVTNTFKAYEETHITQGSTVKMRGYFYFSSHTSGNAILMGVYNTLGTSDWYVRRDAATGYLTFYSWSTGGTAYASTTVMSTGAWHEVELDMTAGSASAPVAIYLDGVNILSTTANTTGSLPDKFFVGDGTTSTVATYYADDLSVDTTNQPGDSASLYVADTLHVAGSSSFGGSMLVQPTSNSAAALQVENNTGANILTADTYNGRVQIGSSTTDATAVLLVADSYNQTTDPTEVDGAMYYNSAKGTFRCGQGGAWRNCLGGGPSNASTATAAPTAGTDTYLSGSVIPLPSGGFRAPTGSSQDGSKITWRVVMSKTAAGTAASTFTIRVGTNGTTADTARCTAFSTGTATAAADWAVVTITVYATAGGSGTTLNCSANLTHQLATTGWSNAGGVQAYSTQTSFDSTPANTKIGLSFNGGTATVATIQSVDTTTTNL